MKFATPRQVSAVKVSVPGEFSARLANPWRVVVTMYAFVVRHPERQRFVWFVEGFDWAFGERFNHIVRVMTRRDIFLRGMVVPGLLQLQNDILQRGVRFPFQVFVFALVAVGGDAFVLWVHVFRVVEVVVFVVVVVVACGGTVSCGIVVVGHHVGMVTAAVRFER